MSTFLIAGSDTSILPTVLPYPGRTWRTPGGTAPFNEYAAYTLEEI